MTYHRDDALVLWVNIKYDTTVPDSVVELHEPYRREILAFSDTREPIPAPVMAQISSLSNVSNTMIRVHSENFNLAILSEYINAINKVDDYFEYAYKADTKTDIKVRIINILDSLTTKLRLIK